MRVSGFEFLRRFLQHVLPAGFQKIRYYGFLSARRRKHLEHVRWLVTLAQGEVYELTSLPRQSVVSRLPTCPTCGSVLTLIGFLKPSCLPVPAAPPAVIDTS